MPLLEYVEYYLGLLRQGNHDDPFISLIEAGPPILPLLIEAFNDPKNREIRAPIVECIWQIRSPEALPFLAEVLHDQDPEVWQQALDGIVTMGGHQAVRFLEAARARLSNAPKSMTASWIDEAIEQVSNGFFN